MKWGVFNCKWNSFTNNFSNYYLPRKIFMTSSVYVSIILAVDYSWCFGCRLTNQKVKPSSKNTISCIINTCFLYPASIKFFVKLVITTFLNVLPTPQCTIPTIFFNEFRRDLDICWRSETTIACRNELIIHIFYELQ